MNRLSFFFFTLIITLISCDGRDRKHKTNAEVLKENKLLDSFSEQIKYVPEQPIEVITDTILSTGFQIKIKYYSLENDYVSKAIESSNKTSNFKNFEAQFQISKGNIVLAQNIINKMLFSYTFKSSSFWDEAIMQFVWIDYENSTSSYINLNTSFCIPETDECKDFVLSIFEDGEIKIKEINLTPNNL